jgi:hypothetical protein
VKEAAKNELRAGKRSAGALGDNLSLWEYAQFQAMRSMLGEDFKPQNGAEQALVDSLAICQTSFLTWMGRLSMQSSSQAILDERSQRDRDGWEPPRLDQAQSMEQSMAMAERFNRMFLRTLRSLRDLRRFNPTVFVQNAGQVNVSTQQIVQQGGSVLSRDDS